MKSFFLGGGRLLAAAAALLRAVFVERLALDVARVAQRHHHVLGCDQVLDLQVGAAHDDLAAALVAELALHLGQLVADDLRHPIGLGEDVEQVLDRGDDLAVLGEDLVLLQAREALQLHLEDALRLHVGEAIACRRKAELLRQRFGTELLRGGAREHLFHERGAPRPRHELGAGDGGCGGALDDGDDFVDVGQRDGEAFEDMPAIARLAQVEHRAARDHLAAMAQERIEELPEIEELRLAVEERDHVHAERFLHRRELVEIVEHDLGHFAALQLDDGAHARLVGLVAQVGNALDALLAHQLADLHQELRLVHLVRKFVDDDRLALALADLLDVGARAQDHAAAARAIAFLQVAHAVDDAGRGEIRRGNDLDELVDRGLGILQECEAGIDHFAEVVRRNVGRHADRDARGAVHQQIRELRRQHQRLMLAAVIVRAEIDGLLVEIGQQLVGDLRHADLGVAHRRGVVAVHRAEVALPVDERITQAEVLRHAHDRVVHRRVAVGMVLTDDIADDARGFLVRLVPIVGELVHREEHAPVDGFQSVAHIREGPADDHAHRIIEVGAAHLLFEADRVGFFCELFHELSACFSL
jgi:hypothetical protein